MVSDREDHLPDFGIVIHIVGYIVTEGVIMTKAGIQILCIRRGSKRVVTSGLSRWYCVVISNYVG